MEIYLLHQKTIKIALHNLFYIIFIFCYHSKGFTKLLHDNVCWDDISITDDINNYVKVIFVLIGIYT